MGRFTVIDNNIIDKQGILNLLKNFIFGNASVEIYDQNKVYNSGDKSFVIDGNTGDIKVVTATENNVTGIYDPSKWNDMTLADTIGSGLDDVLVISDQEPTERITQIWLMPESYSTHYITVPEIPDEPEENPEGIALLFMDGIPIVEDTNTADLTTLDVGDMVFDIEDISTLSIDNLIDIKNADNVVIDEQDDILIHDDPPPSTDTSTILWVDTDLTDDA